MRNFIYSIMNKDKAWANAHLILIDEKIRDDNLFNLIFKFKNHARMKASRKLHQSFHSAFSAFAFGQQNPQQQKDKFNQNQPQNSSRGRGGYRGRRKGGRISFQRKPQPPECLCGEFHYYLDCKYINPAKRQPSWKGDIESTKRVIEALKNPDTKWQVDRIIQNRQKYLQFKENSESNSESSTKPENPESGVFVTDQSTEYYGTFTSAIAFSVSSSFFASSRYALLSS